MQMPFTVVRQDEAFSPPTRSHPADAGLDFAASRPTKIEPGAFAQIPTNLAIAIPKGHYGLLIGRSSAFLKQGLIVQTAVIDAGYRGEVMAMVYNLTKEPTWVQQLQRVFQIVVVPIPTIHPLQVALDRLPTGDRGGDGFGSSGE